MRRWTRDPEREEDKAIRCLAYGIAHADAAFGHRRLATILGTIALDLAESSGWTAAGTTAVRRPGR